MAVYHFHFKHGSRTKGRGGATSSKPHAEYIAREGAYKDLGGFVHAEHHNYPEWARDKPTKFWGAADLHERANGRLYHEFQISIPRELSEDRRLSVVREFVEKEIGDKFAVTIAIHNHKALDGGEHPHAHVMFSSRRVDDGVDRSPELFFKQANTKNPEIGGAKKDSSIYKRNRLIEFRSSWADVANKVLEAEGHRARIDHRTLKEQGIDHTPEPRLGPWRTQRIKEGKDEESRQMLTAMREGRAEIEHLRRRIRTEERVIDAYEKSPDKGGFGGLATIRKAVRLMEEEEQGHAQDRGKSMFKSRDENERGQER